MDGLLKDRLQNIQERLASETKHEKNEAMKQRYLIEDITRREDVAMSRMESSGMKEDEAFKYYSGLFGSEDDDTTNLNIPGVMKPQNSTAAFSMYTTNRRNESVGNKSSQDTNQNNTQSINYFKHKENSKSQANTKTTFQVRNMYGSTPLGIGKKKGKLKSNRDNYKAEIIVKDNDDCSQILEVDRSKQSDDKIKDENAVSVFF